MKICKKIYPIFLTLYLLVSCTSLAWADVKFPKYTPLVNLPDQSGPIDTSGTNLSKYLSGLYAFGVAAAAGLAVIMVILGGIQYITSVAGEGKSGGKQRITSAILGLLLALGSYIILNTINKDLLKLSFDLKDASELNVNLTVKDFVSTGVNSVASGVSGTGNLGNNVGNNLIPDSVLTSSASGRTFITSNPRIGTDGLVPPPFSDPDYRSQTSMPGLNANVHPYVVVPVGSSIPLGTPVLITNNTNGKQVVAVVGDRGPAFGEMSLAAAQAVGVWRPGMGNNAEPHNITFTFLGR